MAARCTHPRGPVRHGWTPERRSALRSYVTSLMESLRLSDWDVAIDLGTDADEDCLAQVSWGNGQTATMWLSPVFGELGPDEQRDVLLHELLHLRLNPLVDLSSAMLEGSLSRARTEMHARALHHDLEHRVDAIAAAFGELLEPPSL